MNGQRKDVTEQSKKRCYFYLLLVLLKLRETMRKFFLLLFIGLRSIWSTSLGSPFFNFMILRALFLLDLLLICFLEE